MRARIPPFHRTAQACAVLSVAAGCGPPSARLNPIGYIHRRGRLRFDGEQPIFVQEGKSIVLERSSDGREAEGSGLQRRRLSAVGVVLGLCAAGIVLAPHLSPVPFLTGGFSLPTSSDQSVNRPASPSNNLFYLEPLIVNTRDIDATDFVRVTLTLELERPDVADSVQARLGAIEHIVVVTVASRGSTMLRSVEGKDRLRDDLMRKINALLPNGGVRSVYFADFLIR